MSRAATVLVMALAAAAAGHAQTQPFGPLELPNGTLLVPYSQPMVTGGTPPYACYSEDSVPGLALVDGSLVGTPTHAGTFEIFAYCHEFNTQASFDEWFTIVIEPPGGLLRPLPLSNGTLNVPYSQPLMTGGMPPYGCYFGDESENGDGLPPGLEFVGETGRLVGIPTQTGTFQFWAFCYDGGDSHEPAGDSLLAYFDVEYTIFIAEPPAIDMTPAPPPGMAGVPYSHIFTGHGGNTPYLWSILSGGTLPPGVTLTASTGALTGAPTAGGTYPFMVRLTEAAGGTATQAFSITVAAPLAITTASLPGGIAGLPYLALLHASGPATPFSWAVIAGTLPPGLALDSSGRIAGSPAAVGAWSFTLRVTDSLGQAATRPFSIVIQPNIPSLEITTVSLPDGTWQVPYTAGITAIGGEQPFTWSGGGFPPGLALGAGGIIAGTPTEVGAFTVSITVRDRAGNSSSTRLALTIKAPLLSITTGSPLGDATMGAPFSQSFSAAGGIPPYTWGIPSGAVPPGTSFSGGTLSGTPLAWGEFAFVVQVRDSRGTIATRAFSIQVGAAPLLVTTTSLPTGRVGQPYSASLGASGGVPPYRWTVSAGAAGLSGDAAGNIGGTPSAIGSHSVSAEVADSRGARASASLALEILGPPLSITTGSLPDGAIGVPYTASFAATGGTPPYQWAAVAGYAGGLNLAPGGAMSGTPGALGEYTVYVQVTDSDGATAVRDFSFRIALPPLTITTSSLPNGMAGSPYSAGLAAAGASGAVTWQADGLPDGLSFDGASGSISGAPRMPGTSSINVRATDAAGRTAARSLGLTVGLPPAPGIDFGVPPTTGPAVQPLIRLGLEGLYPVPISGRIVLTFEGDGGGDDPAVQFSSGGRSVDFTIPAGASLADFPVPNLAMQTGTVAGTITLAALLQAAGADITPSPAPSRTIRVNRMPPVITRVTVARTAGGFDVTITGYSTTREISQAIFRLAQAPGGTLQTSELTVNVDSLFGPWYANPASRSFGSQFTFTQTFNIQGDSTAISSVTAILSNSVGRSEPVTANLP